MRIALVTTEFVTDYRTGGGLGNYLARLAKLLYEGGHSPEVFVLSDRDETFDLSGVVVHRVRSNQLGPIWRKIGHLLRRLPKVGWRLSGLFRVIPRLRGSLALAKAVSRCERAQGRFDLIQSADYLASGFFIRRSRHRPRVVRCSSAADLWAEADGKAYGFRWVHWLGRMAIKRAEYAYAPSAYVADHFRKRYGMNVHVVRPPVDIELSPSQSNGVKLPRRFYLHFGQLRARKGTDVVARALPLVWGQAPDFHMVWAGKANEKQFEDWARAWGSRRSQVHWVGAVEKPVLYSILQHSEAVVLPSRADNLPNTVIESLLFDKPVIGSRGASIDEIVADGENGLLVEIGDERQLADAILRSWRREITWDSNLIEKSPIYEEMIPAVAIQNLLRFATDFHCGQTPNIEASLQTRHRTSSKN